MNRSVYNNLQSKIDHQRQFNTINQTPANRKIGKTKLVTEASENMENFTDITKIRPREELAPIQLKKKINFDPHQNLPIQTTRDNQASIMNTNAFLYSKIPNPNRPKNKKSIIVSDATNIHEYGQATAKSANTNNKAVVSSLIATLGQRKRDSKSVNNHLYIRQKDQSNDEKRLNASPKISIERVNFDKINILCFIV